MNKKKRILVSTDASFLSSGFGVYAKEILSRFHNSDQYEVAELSCYATTTSGGLKSIPWKVYPNAVESKDQRYANYKSNSINQFGLWRFNKVCAHFKPDIVLTWTDYWMYSYQETSPFRPYFNWIQMPMVDSAPQKTEWLYTYINADMIIPYTEWAKKTLIDACGPKLKIYNKPANAGINTTEFFPVENKSEHKQKILGFDGDIIGCVMRNQRRKLFADTMISFRSYLNKLIESGDTEKYNKTFLYLHTSYPEESGWDIPSLLLEYNLLDKVYFSYVCRNCKSYFPSKFKNAVSTCPRCNQLTAFLPNVSVGVDTKQLNEVYNLFDLFLQNSIAEGFGVPQLEAAACGVPFASVDYSAMTEIAENLYGFKIPIIRMFRELETNADRAYPDNSFVTNLIYDFFNKYSYDYKKELSTKTRNACVAKYTWDNVYSVWKDCCDIIMTQNTKKPWSQNNLMDTNHGSMKVPPNLNPKEFVEYVCNNIINDHYLANSAIMKTLIKDLSTKLVTKNGIMQSFDHNKTIEVLQNFLTNKMTCAEIMQKIDYLNEDYLNVSNK